MRVEVLAKVSGIPQSTISGIERDRINLGVERAKQLGRELKCHPAALVFPGWDVENEPAVMSEEDPLELDCDIHGKGIAACVGRLL